MKLERQKRKIKISITRPPPQKKMWLILKFFNLQVLGTLFVGAIHCQALVHHTFVVSNTIKYYPF
jgi:hypothetical protein